MKVVSFLPVEATLNLLSIGVLVGVIGLPEDVAQIHLELSDEMTRNWVHRNPTVYKIEI